MEDVDAQKPAALELGPPVYPGASLQLIQGSSGQSHHVHVGGIFSVSVVGVPTAGYVWCVSLGLPECHSSHATGVLSTFLRDALPLSRCLVCRTLGFTDTLVYLTYRTHTQQPAQAWIHWRKPLGSFGLPLRPPRCVIPCGWLTRSCHARQARITLRCSTCVRGRLPRPSRSIGNAQSPPHELLGGRAGFT